MIRNLTIVKRRGLQFAVALMSAALLIGMSAGIAGNKAFAETQSGTAVANKTVMATDTDTVTKHNVTYNLNGGVNAAANAATYAEGTAMTLADPTRAGFTFAGWTDASGAVVKSIAATSKADVALTANWVSAKMVIKKVKVGKKSVKVTWTLAANANSGYQISINTKKSGTKVAGTVTKANTVTFTKTKLKKGKKYYVSVRAYQTVGGVNIYGGWSKVVKTVKVK